MFFFFPFNHLFNVCLSKFAQEVNKFAGNQWNTPNAHKKPQEILGKQNKTNKQQKSQSRDFYALISI